MCQRLGQPCGLQAKEWGPRRQQESATPSSAGSSVPQTLIQRPGRVFDHWNLSGQDKSCLQNAFLEFSTNGFALGWDRDFAAKLTTTEGFTHAFGLHGNEKWSSGVKFGLLAIVYGIPRNRALVDPQLSRKYLEKCCQYFLNAISLENVAARDLFYTVLFMFTAAIINQDDAAARMHAEGLVSCYMRLVVFSHHPTARDGSTLAKNLVRAMNEPLRHDANNQPITLRSTCIRFLMQNYDTYRMTIGFCTPSSLDQFKMIYYPIIFVLHGLRSFIARLDDIVSTPISPSFRAQR
jgi:hypothetical protein